MIEADRRTALKAGIFVLAVGAILVVILAFLGATRRVLVERRRAQVQFADVRGLAGGAEVRMSGVQVGTVRAVRLAPPPRAGALVEIGLKPDARDRLRADARAALAPVGLLGEYVLELKPGRSAQPLAPGATIPGDVPPDPLALLDRAGRTLERVERLAERAELAVALAGGPEMQEAVANLAATSAAVRRWTEAAARGRGLLHDLAFDPGLARAVRASGADLARAAASLAAAADRAHATLARAERAAAGLGEVVAEVRAGRGTLGGLIYDPAIYENLRTITGRVRRSAILRALVRYAIRRRAPAPPATGPDAVGEEERQPVQGREPPAREGAGGR